MVHVLIKVAQLRTLEYKENGNFHKFSIPKNVSHIEWLLPDIKCPRWLQFREFHINHVGIRAVL